jgi:DNA-binding LacI/PurR family transcriptional regulator
MAVRMKDLADDLGVSLMTVSKALRNHSDFSEKTRARVLKRIRELNAILEDGLRVPEDIAVVGAGNVHYSDPLRVPLSTVDQSSSIIGETAADLLVNCMNSKKPSDACHIFVPPRLVIRDSTRRNSSGG